MTANQPGILLSGWYNRSYLYNMGQRGPIAASNAEKERRGTLRARDAKREVEPDLVKSIPDPPKWLTLRSEKEEWAATAEVLIAAGLLTVADYDTLACYVSVKISWLKERKLARKKPTTSSAKGWEAPSPHYTMAKQYLSDMAKFQAALGMSPASRARVDATPVVQPKKDDLIQ